MTLGRDRIRRPLAQPHGRLPIEFIGARRTRRRRSRNAVRSRPRNSQSAIGNGSLSRRDDDTCGPLAEDRYDMRVKRATLVGQCPIDIHDKGRCVDVDTFAVLNDERWVAVRRQLALVGRLHLLDGSESAERRVVSDALFDFLREFFDHPSRRPGRRLCACRPPRLGPDDWTRCRRCRPPACWRRCRCRPAHGVGRRGSLAIGAPGGRPAVVPIPPAGQPRTPHGGRSPCSVPPVAQPARRGSQPSSR